MLFKGTLNCDPNEPCPAICRLNYMLYMQYSLNEKKNRLPFIESDLLYRGAQQDFGYIWKSVLLVEETRVPVEKQRPVTFH